MNNDKRWILPTLMSVAHLGSEYALARRLLLLDSRLKLAGQPRRGKLGKCGGMRGIHRLDQSIHALPVQCRYRVHFGKRSEEHTSELQSLMRISYAVFCLKK